jgi:hypothetical protein
MDSLQACVREYKKQMERGVVPKAYRGILDYVLQLKTHFKNRHPEYAVPGGWYQGSMDMTYFPLFPKALKKRKLKIAVVFLHGACRFEVWLAGANKQVQRQYWERIRESGWKKYRLAASVQGNDSITESVLAEDPDFDDPAALTRRIESGVARFIQDVERFISAKGAQSAG